MKRKRFEVDSPVHLFSLFAYYELGYVEGFVGV